MSVQRQMDLRRREKSCKGKQRHASTGAAEAAIRSVAERGIDAEGLNTYWCRFCTGYHVGHSRFKR